jgi:hypothetical protein
LIVPESCTNEEGMPIESPVLTPVTIESQAMNEPTALWEELGEQ